MKKSDETIDDVATLRAVVTLLIGALEQAPPRQATPDERYWRWLRTRDEAVRTAQTRLTPIS